MTTKKTTQRHGFKTNEFIVYPAHGVGQIVSIEEQEVAGLKLELFVINFIKDKMTLRVPTTKIATVGMRKLAEGPMVKRALVEDDIEEVTTLLRLREEVLSLHTGFSLRDYRLKLTATQPTDGNTPNTETSQKQWVQ